MQKLAYFIFIIPFTQVLAMDLGSPSVPGNRIITVANTTAQGVTIQVCDPNNIDHKTENGKLWLGTIRRGDIEVSTPKPPQQMHALVIRDTNETATLARTDFEHPEEDGTLFQVFNSEGKVQVEQRDNPIKSTVQPSQSNKSLFRTMAWPVAGTLTLVLTLLALKKYAATE